MSAERRFLPLEPLTRAGFAPFGEVIDAAGVEPEAINSGTAQKFGALARVELPSGGEAALGLYRAQPRVLPMGLLEIERHPLASQAFVPLRPARYLVVVAGSEDRPGPAAVRLFLATGQQGVSLRAGVWHHALLVLDRETDFVVVERASQDGNLERIDTSSWQLWLDA